MRRFSFCLLLAALCGLPIAACQSSRSTASGPGGGTGGSGGAGGKPTAASTGANGGGGAGAGGSGPSGPSTTGSGGVDCTLQRCLPAYAEAPSHPSNVFNDSKAMLGKILFWDEQLGQTETTTCGTCHRPFAGGSDPRTNDPIAMLPGPDGIKDTPPGANSDDLRVAQGVPSCDINGVITDPTIQVSGRKPPTYLDAMFALQVFWDGRAGYCKNNEAAGGCFYDPDLPPGSAPLITGFFDSTSGLFVGAALEAQALGPPVNPVEMACSGRTWQSIAAKLADPTLVPLAKAKNIPQDMQDFIEDHNSNYPEMFEFVYGAGDKVNPATDPDEVINARRIVFAIATHERRLLSNQTPWDLWNDGTPAHADAMTAAQIRGFTVFMGKGKCSTCHAPPLFTDTQFHNIGFHEPWWDAGRQAITGDPADIGKFKTPSLRNVGLREPFGLLHEGDGPGHDLKTMMPLYSQGGKRSDPVIGPLIDPLITPLNLNPGEVSDLIDFLRNGLTDPRVKNETAPFDRPTLATEP